MARPLGALMFGHFGDSLGRKRALAVAVMLMAVPTFLMGLLPTYAQIGIVAPIALVVARVLQGISVGGEFAGSTSFLVGHAQSGRRGYWSWASCGCLLGTVVGSGLGAVLAGALPADALQAWGWRVPFLFGIVVGLAGLYVRRGLDETPAFAAVSQLDGRGVPHARPLQRLLHQLQAGQTVFGGTAPLVATFLVSATGNNPRRASASSPPPRSPSSRR